ncbi:hypothetical protein [Burkholderia glumae]|uniref:hypothetical protein n=1 Tax=Burkholderia glumae TaxID=337 RepID=UPI0021518D88|nr:hypothetical protein [Burkholderia glumae]
MTTTNESSTDNRFYRETTTRPADGGPAFPRAGYEGESSYSNPENGMSLRAYAAINLRVPNSGIDWLDDMIRASMRDELAAKAMQAFIGNNDRGLIDMPWVAEGGYKIADFVLKARG